MIQNRVVSVGNILRQVIKLDVITVVLVIKDAGAVVGVTAMVAVKPTATITVIVDVTEIAVKVIAEIVPVHVPAVVLVPPTQE